MRSRFSPSCRLQHVAAQREHREKGREGERELERKAGKGKRGRGEREARVTSERRSSEGGLGTGPFPLISKGEILADVSVNTGGGVREDEEAGLCGRGHTSHTTTNAEVIAGGKGRT